MDPPPVAAVHSTPACTTPTTVPSHVIFTDPTTHAKLRLLCSYGGHIAPRQHDKVLCYVGGESRIVAVDRRTAVSFSFLYAHLSHTLLNGLPFFLKYQLPNHDLDSLISITTDEDLTNMIDEYERLSLSPRSTHLRFFLFPAKPDLCPPDSDLHDPKSDTWFLDALRNARIIEDSGTGHVVEGHVETEGKCGPESDSVVLETASSFGSTGSSSSTSNLPATRIGGEEGNGGAAAAPHDLKVNLYPVDSIGSESSLASPNFQPQNIFYQDAVVHPDYHLMAPSSAVETESNASDHSPKTVQLKGYPVLQAADQLHHQPPTPSSSSLQPQAQLHSQQLQYLPQSQTVYHDAIFHPEYKGSKVETESNASDSSSKTDLLKKVQVLGYPFSQPIDQLQHQSTPPPLLPSQAQFHYVHPVAPHMLYSYPNVAPTTSYTTVYQPCLQQQQQQQQQGHYQLNKPCPVYLVPVGTAATYDISMPGHLAGSSSVVPTHAPFHTKAVMVTSSLVYDGLKPAPSAPEHASKFYMPATVATQPSNVPSDEHQHQFVTFPMTNQTSPPIISAVAAENASCIGEHEDPVHAQIYKSQPPPPVMLSQFHPVANTAETVLSENLTQLHLDHSMQPMTNHQLL
ncbi:hypothetical protein Ancab_006350 [Ancistrocladus abbreviatus]